MAALKMYSIGHLQGVSSLIPCIFALPWEKISPHNSANERVMLPQDKSPARNRSKLSWVGYKCNLLLVVCWQGEINLRGV